MIALLKVGIPLGIGYLAMTTVEFFQSPVAVAVVAGGIGFLTAFLNSRRDKDKNQDDKANNLFNQMQEQLARFDAVQKEWLEQSMENAHLVAQISIIQAEMRTQEAKLELQQREIERLQAGIEVLTAQVRDLGMQPQYP